MALSDKLIDKRVLRRSLERGLVKPAEFERYLTELPDMASMVDDGEPEARSGEPEPQIAHGVQHSQP